jgi:nitrate reductase gamma subunit
MSVQYRWASYWAALTLTPWVRSVLRLQPDPQLVDAVPDVAKLHVFAGLVLVTLLPFTSVFRKVDAWLGRMAGALEARITQALGRWCGPLVDEARRTWRGLLSPESED